MNADYDSDALTIVVGLVACGILTTILLCLCRLRREERQIIRRNLLGRSSSNVTELSSTADGIIFDQRPLEGLEEARAAQEAKVASAKAANHQVAAPKAPATEEAEAAPDGLPAAGMVPAAKASAAAATSTAAAAANTEEPSAVEGRAGNTADQ